MKELSKALRGAIRQRRSQICSNVAFSNTAND